MRQRGLTANEKRLAQSVFADSLNLDAVVIHRRKFLFFQPKNSAMAPNGSIYFSEGAWLADFSLTDQMDIRGFFIHELAHVWQQQLQLFNPVWAGIKELITHAFRYRKAYYYQLDASLDLLDYGIEQQACIIEDYYLLQIQGAITLSLYCLNVNAGAQKKELRELQNAVLEKFLKDPGYPRRDHP